jgi:nucleotide-binding universal stress UspA family protein
MLPIKKILCPTDFSEPSYVGLDAASEMALLFTSPLILVHVVSPMPTMPGAAAPTGYHIPSMLKELEAAARQTLRNDVMKQLPREIASKSLVEEMVVQGDPATEIVRIAKEEHVSMIVTATHGTTGWRRLIFGSVAERVVRLAECPVLTIPAPEEEGG